MTPLNTPILFLATSNPERSRAFYEHTLGLSFIADEPFALVFQCGPSQLRIAKVDRVHPLPYTVLGWSVPDIRAAVQTLAARGITFQRYPHFNQDADNIWHSPSGAAIAWFQDPEGHTLSLTQPPR